MADTPVRYGQDNTGATSRTLIANDLHTDAAGVDLDNGVALVGLANNHSAGVIGQSLAGSGVVGWAGSGTPPAHTSQHAGVWGYAEGNFYGVIGRAEHGIGVFGMAAIGGYFEGRDSALVAEGEVYFASAATSVIPAGRDHVSLVYPALENGSKVLATLQTYAPGVWVAGVEIHPWFSVFTIWLNQAVQEDTDVAWFVIKGGWGLGG